MLRPKFAESIEWSVVEWMDQNNKNVIHQRKKEPKSCVVKEIISWAPNLGLCDICQEDNFVTLALSLHFYFQMWRFKYSPRKLNWPTRLEVKLDHV